MGGPIAELTATATVLEDREHGPQLVLGVLLMSLPPQGGGLDLVGWDWEAVGGYEHVGSTRWGRYAVVGTYDPEAFTFSLTRPARVPEPEHDRGERPSDPEFSTPCPEPEGGWRVLDPALATEAALDRTLVAVHRRPDYGSCWLDQSRNPFRSGHDEESARRMNDPEFFVLNVTVTGDVAAAEADLRRTWGGALCVSRARRTSRELRRILDELTEQVPRMLMAGTSMDLVELTVVWDDGSLQREADARYGPGVVRVRSQLRPFEGPP